MSDDQSTRAAVERFYAAIGAMDEEGLRAVFHEDAELHQPPTLPYGGVYRGVDEMLKLWQGTVLKLGDPTSFVMEGFLVDGDTAAVIVSSKGATTGKPVLACEEYTVRDGKISRIRMFWFDPTPFAEEANALAASAS
jgi:ketosteroid isomerase-like protein